MKIVNLLSLSKILSSADVEDGSGHGRGRTRQRQILLATLAGILARAASILTVLITTPLTYEYLGEERFGLWTTITSIVAFLSFADLGIGNGLMSSIATAKGANDRDKIKSLVSSGYALLTIVAGLLLLLLWAVYPLISWTLIFNVQTEPAVSEAGPATAVFLVLFAINVPVMMIQRVQLGLQDAHIYSLWQIISGILSIGAIYLAIIQKCGLPVLILALSGPPLIANICNTIVSFWKKYADIRPSPSRASVRLANQMLALGGIFLFLQFAGTFNNLIDKFIIAQILGSEAVAPFAVVERLFNLIITLIAVVLIPLWPALSEALERGDFNWIDKTFRHTMLICVAFTVPVAVAMIFVAPTILDFWIPSAPTPEALLLSGFAIWKIVESMTSIVITYMNGLKILKFQLVLMTLAVVLITPLKIILIREAGVAGAPWGMAFGMTACILLPFYAFRKTLIASSFDRSESAWSKRDAAR